MLSQVARAVQKGCFTTLRSFSKHQVYQIQIKPSWMIRIEIFSQIF